MAACGSSQRAIWSSVGKKLDCTHQPYSRGDHKTSSNYWNVGKAGGRWYQLWEWSYQVTGAWIPELHCGTWLPMTRNTHIGCFVCNKYSNILVHKHFCSQSIWFSNKSFVSLHRLYIMSQMQLWPSSLKSENKISLCTKVPLYSLCSLISAALRGLLVTAALVYPKTVTTTQMRQTTHRGHSESMLGL